MKPLSLHLESVLSNVPKGEMSRDADFFIIGKDFRPLLGAETCQELNLIKVMASDISESETVNSINDKFQTAHFVQARDQIFKEYSDVFEGLECMDGPYHMELDEAVKPVVHPSRKVTVALKDLLKEELDKLVREKVITPFTAPTNWVSSLDLVKKPKKLEIFIDPQDLNRALLRAHYPLSTIEDVATRLCKAKVFSVLDAKNGFWQFQLDKPSSLLTTFNTPFGGYCWLRLPFGIKTAAEGCQWRIHESLQGLKSIKDIVDDILCVGKGYIY